MSQPFTDSDAERLATLWEDYKKRSKNDLSYTEDGQHFYINGRAVTMEEFNNTKRVQAGVQGGVQVKECKCHCHNYHEGMNSYSDAHIRCKCIPNCEHCNPNFKPSESETIKNDTNWEDEFEKIIVPKLSDVSTFYGVKNMERYLKDFIKQQRLLAKKEIVSTIKKEFIDLMKQGGADADEFKGLLLSTRMIYYLESLEE